MDYDYEPYQNDLEEWGNNEAWEDARADMVSDRRAQAKEEGYCYDCGNLLDNCDCEEEEEVEEEEEGDSYWEAEDRYLDSQCEDRAEMGMWWG